MRILRTLFDMDQVLTQPLDPPLREALEHHEATWQEFGDDLGLMIVIAEAGDALPALESACGHTLVADDSFAFPVETITELSGWWEVIWIMSDDGSGLVLYIENADTTDAGLLTASRKARSAQSAGYY